MRPLHVKFRHEVRCSFRACAKKIADEQEVTKTVHPDGSPVSLPGFDTLKPQLFELSCPDGHMVTVHFPKDVSIVRTPTWKAAASVRMQC
jgi:hypothetical protein